MQGMQRRERGDGSRRKLYAVTQFLKARGWCAERAVFIYGEPYHRIRRPYCSSKWKGREKNEQLAAGSLLFILGELADRPCPRSRLAARLPRPPRRPPAPLALFAGGEACASADWLPRKNRRARPATPNRRCPGRVSARLEFFRMRRRPLPLSFYRACCAYCAFCAAGLCSSRFGASKLAPFLRLGRWAACLATLVYCRRMKKPR